MKVLQTLFTFFTFSCLCTTAQAQLSAYGAAAKVNGVQISNSTLEKNFEEYQREKDVNIAAIRYPDRIKEMRRDVLDQLIDQELVWQTVQAKALFASPDDIDKSVEDVRAQFDTEDGFLQRIMLDGFTPEKYRVHVQRLVSVSNYMQEVSSRTTVSKEEVHEFYVNNPDKLGMPETVRARHILLKVHPNANDDTKKGVEEKMTNIVEHLENGADFSTLAVQYSEDGSSSQGGDLGYFDRGQMVGPFSDAAFSLDVGETSGIVETVYGLHLIRVEDRQPVRTVPEEMASEQIFNFLLDSKRRQAIRDELLALRAGAEIEILVPL